MKAGYKTTEFWITAVGAILSIAIAGGYIQPDQAGQITSSFAETLNATVKLVEALGVIGLPAIYVWSRTRVKTS